MKHLLQFIIFLLFPLGGFSQQAELIGTLQNETTKDYLPFIAVILSKDSITQYQETDLEGSFVFDSLDTGTYNLKTLTFGFKTIDTTININSNTNSIHLSLSVDTLSYEKLKSGYNKKGALKDIQNGNITLLLPGGLAGAEERSGDKSFTEKYDLVFISQGCIRLPGENEEAYNKEMFKYLDKKYGRVWRRHVRNDVIGL